MTYHTNASLIDYLININNLTSWNEGFINGSVDEIANSIIVAIETRKNC